MQAGSDMAAALGDRVVGSLEGRGLIHHVDVGAVGDADPDRIAGVVLGLAAGNAVGQRARQRPGECRDADVRDVVRGLARSRLAGARGAGRAARPPAVRLAVARPRRGHGRANGGAAVPPGTRRRPRSYGNAALCRAAAVGVVRADDPHTIGEAASIDAAVTHASRRATASSAALAGIVAALVRRQPSATPADVIGQVVGSVGHDHVRATLQLALTSTGLPADQVVERIGDWPHATSTLALGAVVRARARRPGRGHRHRRGDQRPRRHRRRRHRRHHRGDPRGLGPAAGVGRRARRSRRLPRAGRAHRPGRHRPSARRAGRRRGDLVPARPVRLDGSDRRRCRHRVRPLLRRAARHLPAKRS